jgi:hypothetical protein
MPQVAHHATQHATRFSPRPPSCGAYCALLVKLTAVGARFSEVRAHVAGTIAVCRSDAFTSLHVSRLKR